MRKHTVHSMIAIFAMLCLVISTPVTTAAAKNVDEPMIQPRYTGIFQFAVDLDISSSGYASCYGYVAPSSGYSVDLTMELQRDGTTIKSWTASGSTTFSMDKGYYVTKGHDYQVVLTANVKNSKDITVSTPSLTSNVVSY